MSRFTANSLLLLAAAIWGGGFVAQAAATDFIGPGWYTSLRFLLAVLAVAPFGLMEARRHPGKLDWPSLLPLGAVFAIASLLQQQALMTTSVTHTGFLTGLYVIFVPLIETFLIRRAPHPAIWAAALLALMGTYLLGGGLLDLHEGDLLVIVSALAYAVQILLLDRYLRRNPRPVAAALFQSFCCVLLGAAFGLLRESFPAHFAPVLPQLLYGGIMSAGLAFLLQAIAQKFSGPADAAVMLMSESLFAALFAFLILHERLDVLGRAGCALLFCALLLAQLGPLLAPSRANLSLPTDSNAAS